MTQRLSDSVMTLSKSSVLFCDNEFWSSLPILLLYPKFWCKVVLHKKSFILFLFILKYLDKNGYRTFSGIQFLGVEI